MVLDVHPEVAPVAMSLWVPLRLTPGTATVQKAPLASATTDGYLVPLSRAMATVSPAWKPEPQNVTLDPAVGAWLLTEVVG